MKKRKKKKKKKKETKKKGHLVLDEEGSNGPLAPYYELGHSLAREFARECHLYGRI